MIHPTVLRATWHELLRGKLRIGLILGLFLPSLVQAYFTGEAPTSGSGALVALILCAGIISGPSRDGTLALVFIRPIRRSTYLLTRWFGAASLGTGACALGHALATVLALHRGQWAPGAFGEACLGDAIAVFGTSACIVLFSAVMLFSFLNPVADSMLWIFLVGVSHVLAQIGGTFSKPSLTWMAGHLEEWTKPAFDPFLVFRSTPISWSKIAAYFLVVVVCLTLGIELLNRKELSYASTD